MLGIRQPQLVLKVSQVPDWGRRAIRLSLALTFFTTIAIWLWPVPEHLRAEWGDEVRQTCNWAGASCAVVAASPLIGKVAQLSYERTLGTLTGGLLGFLVYDFGVLRLPDPASDVLMVASAAAVGALSCYLSFKFSLDASMRLFVITFLIVMFGGGTHSAAGVALLRTGGIVTGVLLFMCLTVIILPKSATIEALRELKNGLKLLTELNTLVWTSKQEAEAALKAAAEQARAAELAAAAAAANAAAKANSLATAAGVAAAGGSWPAAGSKSGKWHSVSTALGALLFRSQANASSGYVPLPGADTDPELGATAAAPAPAAAGLPVSSSTAQPAAAAAGHPVSHLTQALRGNSNGNNSSSSRNKDQLPSTAAAAHSNGQQQQQQQQCQSYSSAEYEERCEAVLTKVYSSCFKVKEHVALAESELYVHHFCGHYIFLPVFFTKAFLRWAFPRRWVLPAAALEEVSTSVRVIARLLWTVHLDFSQEGFDEVIQALPPAAGMGNLLLDLAGATSACLGVLVEAFPNKEAVLVDHLKALEELVNRMLEVSEEQHKGLIEELAAKRHKQPTRPYHNTTTAAAPCSPQHHHQQQQQQQQQQRQQVGSAGGAPQRNSSPFSRLSQQQQQQPGHQLGGSRPASGETPLDRAASSTLAAAAAARCGAFSPRAQHHLQQLQQQQQCFQQQQQQHGQQQGPRHVVVFVTYQDHPEDSLSVGDSCAVDGPGPPIPAESPELMWSPTAAAAAAAAVGDTTAAAPAVVSVPSQGDLIFEMADSPSAAAAAAGGSSGRGQGEAGSSTPSAAAAAARVGSLPSLPPPAFGRSYSHARSSGGGGVLSGVVVPASLIRSQFRSFVRAPTLKLDNPCHQPASGGSAGGAGSRGGGAGHSRLSDLGSGSPHRLGQSAQQQAEWQQHQQQQQQQQEKEKEGSSAQGQQHHCQLQQQQQPGVGSADAGESRMSLVLEALNDPETMSFVKLTRWYSFQFLIMELLMETHDLYHAIRTVLAALPHGL